MSSRFPALLALLALLSLPAFADNRKEAAESIKKGNGFLEKRQYQEAITRFEIALKLDPSLTSPYAGMGFAYQGMGRCEDALKSFQAYLTKNPDGSVVKEVKAASAACKATLYCKIAITSNPPGAAVYFGEPEGEPVGYTPYTIDELKTGEYRISLSLDGYEPWSMDLSAAAGSEYIIPEVALQKIGSNLPPAPVEPVVIVKEAPLPTLKRSWLGVSLNSVVLDAGVLGTGLEISFLRRTAGQGSAFGIRTTVDAGVVDVGIGGIAIELGLAYHLQPSLSKSGRERLDIGLEGGVQLGGGVGLTAYAQIRPGLAFHVGERGLFFFRPVSVGVLASSFQRVSLELLAFGYAFGF